MAIVAAALALVGCDDDDGGPQTSNTVAPTVGAARPTATLAPEETRDDGAIESPERALRRQIDLINQGNYGAAWDELHPAQQAVVTRDRFIECNSPNDFELGLDIIETQDALIDVPALSRVPAKVIATRITSVTQTLDRNFFEVLVEGRWRWVLEQAQFDAYSSGNCP